jgi:hypothetical protein
MSRAVSVAAQKYGGDSTYPIWRDVGTTSMIDFPSSCGRPYLKFHSSPAAQSIRQKPSLISHFAMNIFASLSASANAWMMWAKHLAIWLMAPAGAVFLVVLLTAEQTLLFARHKRNDKSKMEQKAFNLCGIAAIGNIFSSFGGLSLMVSQSTNLAWFVRTFRQPQLQNAQSHLGIVLSNVVPVQLPCRF